MNRRVTILGKKVLPWWLIVVMVIATGLGAATGTSVAGRVVGEISVSASSSLLVGSPLSNMITHTPNDANWENDDALFNENPTAAWAVLTNPITDLTNLEFPDNRYQSTAASAGNYSQQFYKFYVGPDVGHIRRMEIKWKGYAPSNGNVMVWEGGTVNAWNTASQANVTHIDATHTINIEPGKSPVTVEEAYNNGYVYVQAVAGTNAAIHADYVTLTVTYSAFDLVSWANFAGPQIARRFFTVPSRHVGVHEDKQTAFEAASELAIGDWWLFALPIKNHSNQEVIAKMTLIVPTDLNVYVFGADEMDTENPRITNVVSIGWNVWKFVVNARAHKQDENDYLYIVVNAHDDGTPANLKIDAVIQQIMY